LWNEASLNSLAFSGYGTPLDSKISISTSLAPFSFPFNKKNLGDSGTNIKRINRNESGREEKRRNLN
jgi:hypothetical protein